MRQNRILHGKKTRLSVKHQTVMPSAVPTSMKNRYAPFPAYRANSSEESRTVSANQRSSTAVT